MKAETSNNWEEFHKFQQVVTIYDGFLIISVQYLQIKKQNKTMNLATSKAKSIHHFRVQTWQREIERARTILAKKLHLYYY